MKDWKKWLKWIIPFLITLILLVILWPKSKALENVPDEMTVSEVFEYKDINIRKATFDNKTVYIYCIEGGRGNVNEGNLLFIDKDNAYTNSNGIVDDDGIRYIALNGFQGDASGEMSEDDKKNYYITQLAVWLYYYEIESDKTGNNPRIASQAIEINKSDYVPESGYEELIEGAKDLCQKALNARNNGLEVNNISYSVTNDNKNLKVTSDNNYIESELVTITLSGVDTYKATVDNSKYTIVDANGNYKTTFKNGDKIKVRASKNQITESGNVKLNLQINYNEYTPYQYYPDGQVVYCVEDYLNLGMAGCDDQSQIGQIWYHKQSMLYIGDPSEKTINQEVIFTYTKSDDPVIETKYNISISKQDATTGNELAGAKLKLVDNNGNIVDEWTSTTTPHVVRLTKGTYHLTETIAPNGYVRNEETVTFTVNEDGTTDGDVVMLNRYIEVPKTALNNPTILLISYIVFAILGIGLVYLGNKKIKNS